MMQTSFCLAKECRELRDPPPQLNSEVSNVLVHGCGGSIDMDPRQASFGVPVFRGLGWTWTFGLPSQKPSVCSKGSWTLCFFSAVIFCSPCSCLIPTMMLRSPIVEEINKVV